MALRAVEWEVCTPLDGHLIAIVRLVRLGSRAEPYFRAVTPEADRSQRRLIGYWGSAEEAARGVLALYERATGRALSGGGNRPSTMQLVPQKPPPVDPPAGYASPVQHFRREHQGLSTVPA